MNTKQMYMLFNTLWILILLKRYVSKFCQCYIYCVNFYIISVFLTYLTCIKLTKKFG